MGTHVDLLSHDRVRRSRRLWQPCKLGLAQFTSPVTTGAITGKKSMARQADDPCEKYPARSRDPVAMISMRRGRWGLRSAREQASLKLLKLLIGPFVEGVYLLDLLFGHERGYDADIGDGIFDPASLDRRGPVLLEIVGKLGEEAFSEPVPRTLRSAPRVAGLAGLEARHFLYSLLGRFRVRAVLATTEVEDRWIGFVFIAEFSR